MAKIKKWELSLEGLEELVVAIESADEKAVEQSNKVVKNNTEKVGKTARKYAAVDTWFMHDNISTNYESKSNGITEGIIHSEAGYSGYVEYGTRKMMAQPFMHPAVEEQQPIFLKDMKKVAEGAFK